MKRLALLAASAAAIGLSACTHSSAPHASKASHASKPTVPVSCGQQYRAWMLAEGKGVMGAFASLSSAAAAGDAHALTVALREAGAAVPTATQHPIPACADPRGFWDPLLMHVNAAAGAKQSKSSLHAAVHDLPRLHQELLAEVRQTAR